MATKKKPSAKKKPSPAQLAARAKFAAMARARAKAAKGKTKSVGKTPLATSTKKKPSTRFKPSTSSRHTDTKSHNVKISVMSGYEDIESRLNDLKYLLKRINEYETKLTTLQKIKPQDRTKFDVVAIDKAKDNIQTLKIIANRLKNKIKI